MNKIATLFGGGMNDTTTKEYKDTVKIGEILASSGYSIKCGGYYGLMEAVAKGSLNKSGFTVGITCAAFKTTVGNEYLNSTVVAPDIYNRLEELMRDSEVFIVQKGGVGTLAEFFLLWDNIRKVKSPPKVILVGNHWYKILEAVELVTTEKEESLLQVITDIKDLKSII